MYLTQTPVTLGVAPKAITVAEALASDQLRLRTMGTLLDMLTWLTPMDAVFCYAISEEGEKYAGDPVVARIARSLRFTAEQGLDDYFSDHGTLDPFAPCRLPDQNVTIATTQDVPGSERYAEVLVRKYGMLPAANIYLRDADRIVAGISLARSVQAPSLSISERATLHHCHGWFEFWYSLGLRNNPSTARYAVDPRLTPREREVLQALTTPQSYEAIARQLEISVATLKTHIRHTLRKLGVRNRAEAVALVLSAIQPPPSFD